MADSAQAAFSAVLTASLVMLPCSIAIEQLMRPRPTLRRSSAAWSLHAGLCLAMHAMLTLLLARPWFAASITLACLLLLVLVNNAKYTSLDEPFVFADHQYFTDAICHPRLYIPFLGWPKLLLTIAGFITAIMIGLYGEAVPVQRFDPGGQLDGLLLVGLVAGILVYTGNARQAPVRFSPATDTVQLGLLASLWCYACQTRWPQGLKSPLKTIAGRPAGAVQAHMVAVQSESFFDPRPLYPGIRRDVLAAFDHVTSTAVLQGKLDVPAWGANTVRSEFAFLTGIPAGLLGGHQFNPYRPIARGHALASLARVLKEQGYRTVCIHPYPASFYQRNKVFPVLGFDEFIDDRSFNRSHYFGPYISDQAVTDKVTALLQASEGPLFVFVITMENHGPLHLEPVTKADEAAYFTQPPPAGCSDLTVYLRHLKNADNMMSALCQQLASLKQAASLCWYGDHVPIMPGVYRQLGKPDAQVPYFIWHNRHHGQARCCALPASSLAATWLDVVQQLASNNAVCAPAHHQASNTHPY